MLTWRLEDLCLDDDLQRPGPCGATEGVARIEVAVGFAVICDRVGRFFVIRGAPVVPNIVVAVTSRAFQ